MKIYLAVWALFLLYPAVFGGAMPFSPFVFVGLIVWGVVGGLRAISGGEFYSTK